MDEFPDKAGALSRAYTMRSMRDEGAHVGLVAALFGYSVSSVEAMIQWHEKLFPVMPDRDGVPAVDRFAPYRRFKPP
jgi:hypothetical protein